MYLKFDIIGKYCAFIIDENSPNIIKNGGGSHGSGLTGVLIKESSKWNKNWKDNKGKKKKILFVSTLDLYPYKEGLRNANCNLANFLSRKELKEITKEKFPEIDIKGITFEKVINIIHSLNE